jgi:DNA repair protein RecO (recombination protein O)
MKVEQQPCYILHLRPYRESSLLVELLSREHGRLGVVARGARRGTNRSRGSYQLFQRLSVSWSMRTELGTLTQIESEPMPGQASGRWLMAAFYLNELLLRLLQRDEPHPEIFGAYELALVALRTDGDEAPVLRVFEKRLLEALGYGLLLDRDAVTGQPIDAERTYIYVADRGPVANGQPGMQGVTISGATLLALQAELLRDAGELQQAKRLMRRLVDGHLDGRPLASRELYRQYLHNGGARLPVETGSG